MTADFVHIPLTRYQSSDFIRLEGLQKLTNVTAHDWEWNMTVKGMDCA